MTIQYGIKQGCCHLIFLSHTELYILASNDLVHCTSRHSRKQRRDQRATCSILKGAPAEPASAASETEARLGCPHRRPRRCGHSSAGLLPECLPRVLPARSCHWRRTRYAVQRLQVMQNTSFWLTETTDAQVLSRTQSYACIPRQAGCTSVPAWQQVPTCPHSHR